VACQSVELSGELAAVCHARGCWFAVDCIKTTSDNRPRTPVWLLWRDADGELIASVMTEA